MSTLAGMNPTCFFFLFSLPFFTPSSRPVLVTDTASTSYIVVLDKRSLLRIYLLLLLFDHFKNVAHCSSVVVVVLELKVVKDLLTGVQITRLCFKNGLCVCCYSCCCD